MIISSKPTTYPKLESLILCLAGSAPDIGITKLEKLLYLCDFEAVKELGESISGDPYRNFQWGPVPKHFIPAYENLLSQRRLEKEEIKLNSGKKFTKLTVKERCGDDAFNKDQWVLIDRVLGEHGHKTSAELVKLTHEELTWKLTERNEEIPEFLAHYRNYKKPTPQQLEKLITNADYINSVTQQAVVAK